MLKIRNGAVRTIRFVLVGVPSMLELLFSGLSWLIAQPGDLCNWLRWWMSDRLPKVKLSPMQEAEWDAYEKERRDRFTMTLAEFDAAYPPGEPIDWCKGEVQHMKLHGIDVSVDVDSFQPKEGRR